MLWTLTSTLQVTKYLHSCRVFVIPFTVQIGDEDSAISLAVEQAAQR